MPVPESVAAPSGGVYRPAESTTNARFQHRLNQPFVLQGDPRTAEVVELTKEFAEKLGLEAGKYIVPNLISLLATPGANGVRGDANWSIERLLSLGDGGGFHEVAKTAALRGVPLLDPILMAVPPELLPEGEVPGGYLRFDLVHWRGQVGRCHRTVFESMEDAGIGEEATLKMDHARFAAWRVWLVLKGFTPEVNAAAVEREKRVWVGRVARVENNPAATEAQRKASAAPRKAELAKISAAKPVARKGA